MTSFVDNSTSRLTRSGIYLKHTGTAKGRGVFASRNFSEGEIIEECPVLLFKAPFSPPGDLKRVIFSWLALAKPTNGYISALALGFGSMYNHDNPANMRYEADKKNLTLKFSAARNIRAGEELTINYNARGGEASSDDNIWFERMNVRPIVSDR